MCGIVGYIGGQNAVPILMEGLARLEYRGYDSAGIAIMSAKGTQVCRRVGRVRDLEASLPRRLSGKSGTSVWVRFALMHGQLQSDWSAPVLVTFP